MTLAERTTMASRLISAGDFHTLGVKADGSVLSTGKNRSGQCDVENWTNIVAIAAGDEFSVGVLRNGTVITCGKRHSNSKNVKRWSNIVAVSAGAEDIIGLTVDGRAIFSGNSLHSEQTWSNITSIEASGHTTLLGISNTRRVVVGGCSNRRFINYIMSWTDVIAVAAGCTHIIGLHSTGTVSAIWDERYNVGQCDIDNWRNIIAIAAGMDHTVGLKADGTVVAAGPLGDKRCDVSRWRNIIAVAAGKHHTIGLKADGTLIATGDNKNGQCNVSGWKLF